MMHLQLIGLAAAIAVVSRLLSHPVPLDCSWQTRWHRALTAFVVPPLLLLATAVSIITMGADSAYLWEGRLSFALSTGFLALAGGLWAYLVWLALKTQRELQRYPVQSIQTGAATVTGRVMDVPAVFSAQVGLWSSDLIVSQGLLGHLDEAHLAAVFAHEAGHAHYRDTFWFFWLGGLRRLTCWLPYTEDLWQELLLLREVRADQWAARSVDTLVLAESLLSVITAPLMTTEAICAGFSCAAPHSRLAQRVDALLADRPDRASDKLGSPWQWTAIALALTPLLAIPFHH
ncbi:M56 family metallopeptidase [Leptolyngbya sp. BC1307]|uniref:M56 family metallopeptidase n=1 Tax=Leptolyngbya sp. BC1307 TaxID=2029589 RepID=UPI00197CE4D0|nr:M56 family metallopeptidase [Leptolyngbya sp. BC1307]